MQRTFAVILASSLAPPWEAETLPPTATEVFHLRSECAAFGAKILDESFARPNIDRDQVSHYDTKSNRCYVEIDTQTRSPPVVFQRYLEIRSACTPTITRTVDNGSRSPV